jgi:hypothetical protein
VKADRLRERGDPAAAAAAYREALSLVQESGPGSEGRLAQLESDLGGCLTALGKLDEAEPLLTRSHRDLELLEGKMGEGLVTTQQTLNRLVDLYTAWGKPEEAARYREMLPAISVSEVRDLGRVRFVPQVFTRGGGLSASFGGRSAWVFKETRAFGRGEAGPKRIDSSWGLAETATSADLPTVTGPTDGAGNLLELIPRTAQEPVEDWSLEPGAVVWDGARDRALVFYAKKSLHALEQRRVGSSLALWPRPDAPAVRPLLRPGAEEPTLLFDAEEPAWGSGALTSGNWLYTYACKQQKGSLEVPCLLARVPLDRALDRGAWTFYAGGSWSSDWRGATAVIDAVPPMSVAWNGYLGKYVAVSTRILSDMIRIRTADRPEGPWSEAVLVQGLAPAVGFPWIGPGIGHPELAREGGRVEILTYTRAVGIGGNETRAVEIEFRKR